MGFDGREDSQFSNRDLNKDLVGTWVRIQYGQHDVSVFGVYRGLTSDGHFELMPYLNFESLPTDAENLRRPYVMIEKPARIAHAGPVHFFGVREEYIKKLLERSNPSEPNFLSDINFA